jgi:hypothetical protein
MAVGPRRELHIGIDAEKVVVAPIPLRMRTGRARRRRLGTVTEVVPVPPSGRTRADRSRFASQLSLVLIVFSAVLAGLGFPWWVPAVGSMTLVAFVIDQQRRAARTGYVAVPDGEDCHVLYAREERAAYQRAVAVAHRVRRTWPNLQYMIDPDDADRSLARALDDLAAVMARRQQIRRLRAELADVDDQNLPEDSPAIRALAAQRARVEALWRETAASANHIIAAMHAAALTGENLIRERHIGQTARDVELVVTRLSAADRARSVEAAPELAERTAAVVAAYRELAAGA